MNNIILNDKLKIEDMIYEIRGKQVILDRHLAQLYNVETRVFMQSVKRNINRFPETFMFQLTIEEFKDWKSQIVISKNDRIGLRRPPYAFTEQGVAMLAGVLRSPIAIKTSIIIIEAFVAMRKYISTNLLEQKYINELVLKNTKRIDVIENQLSDYQEKNTHLFFKGQVYDAYSLLINIIKKARKEIIIIDNYIDKNLLDILCHINKKIVIITNKYNNHDYTKYKMQYDNIDLIINNTFHDRFIIIDKKTLYHSGASFKDLGKKCFEISKIEDKDILKNLLKKIL